MLRVSSASGPVFDDSVLSGSSDSGTVLALGVRLRFGRIRSVNWCGIGGVSDTSGHDETAQVNDDVLLVMQAGKFIRPAGTPTSVGIHWAQRQPAVGLLEVSCIFALNSVVVNRRPRNHEHAIDLHGLLLELFDGPPVGRQVMAVHVALTRLESTYIFGDSNPTRSSSSFKPSKTALKPSLPIRSMKWLMLEWSNTGSSMVRKQNQR